MILNRFFFVYYLSDAREIINRLMGRLEEWTSLDAFLHEYLVDPEERPGVIASSFAASLELVREGALELRQTDAFAPIYMRQPENKSTNAAAQG